MKGTLTLAALSTEVFTTTATGFANFFPYLNLENMQSGDEIEITQYIDVEATADMKKGNVATISYDDLIATGEEAAIAIPFNLESGQSGRIGVTLTAGTTPLLIGWRITNIKTGA